MGAAPSCQTIALFGVNSVTLSLKTRSGATGTLSWIVSPGAMLPSMLWTVEFQRGKSCALVNRDQIVSGFALIVVVTPTSIRNVLRLLLAFPFAAVVIFRLLCEFTMPTMTNL